MWPLRGRACRRVADCEIRTCRSSEVGCSSPSASWRTPKRRATPLDNQVRATVNGALIRRNQWRGLARNRALLSGFEIAIQLRRLLADGDVERGDQRVGDRHRDRHRGAVREAAEDRLDQLGDSGLAEEADADRGHRDPELAGREVLVDLVELLEHRGRSPVALTGELSRASSAASGRARTRPQRRPQLTAINRSSRTSRRALIVVAPTQMRGLYARARQQARPVLQSRPVSSGRRPIGRAYFEGDRRRSLATSQGYRTARPAPRPSRRASGRSR